MSYRDRLSEYERQKKELEKKNLQPEEYQKQISELARRLGV